ncbi:hypothetical protein QFC19_004473 [Naganishia cerealis]|uniref:Uncharacterized protein n=1 Tax=Naganishia cerealis TaxID=610337 RepID=A0ACC2VV92_9TREE|nr:hypothetical protein QFC19_004473 [Naganishia cerealis]
MSALHHDQIGGPSVPGTGNNNEPDSELRDALQRVARDLEIKNRQRRQHEAGRHDEVGIRKEGISHAGDDMQVEDILDQAALEVQGDDMAFEISSSEQACRSSIRDTLHSGEADASLHASSTLTPTSDHHDRTQNHIPSGTTAFTDETSRIMLASLKRIPSMGFMKFLDDWLEGRGLKAVECPRVPDGPSPVIEAWSSLDPNQRSHHEARARSEPNGRRLGEIRHPLDHQQPTLLTGSSVDNCRTAFVRTDTTEDDEKATSMIGRTFSETEKRYVGDIISNIVQELDILYRSTGTNYLLLSAPVFPAPDLFPVLAHSPPAASFWQSLRGGPGTNLTKFLALSHPAVTSRRLAIPTGARSLDVKSRLNSSMRQMIREASNVADAEMKWTRPDSLIQIYGVKIVGWPMGAPGTPDEMVPMRNPSNNSVAQNKLLLQRIESGILRVEAATDADRLAAAGLSPSHLDHHDNSAQPHNGGSDSNRAMEHTDFHTENNRDLQVEGEDVYEDLTSLEALDRVGESSRRGRGRTTKIRGTAPSSRSKYRSKSLLTLNPDGSIRPGGLDGKRKPGRPRKTMPTAHVEVPHASTRFQYHVNQQPSTQDRHPSPIEQVQAEDTVEPTGDSQSLYIQQEELGEANSEIVLAMMGPALAHPGRGAETRYASNPSVLDNPQRNNGVHQQAHSDHLPSPLDQALSHIEYYQVTGPNFGNHPNHGSQGSRSHDLSNIAPHFPLPPPDEHHGPSHHSSDHHEEQQYISDFTTRLPIINPYNTHFSDTADQGGVEHESWHEQRNPEESSTDSSDTGQEGNRVSLAGIQDHVHHGPVEDNPDMVDGIDMEAAFGNHELSSGDPLSDRNDMGEMSDAHMRAFLVSQPPLPEPNEGDESTVKPGKRKADEM